MTGVLSYGVFVDVGVNKDGLLHVKEVEWLFGGHVHDLREYVRVGEKLRFLYVLTIDEKSGRFTLTTRPRAAAHRAIPPASGKEMQGDATAVEMATAEVKAMAKDRAGPGAHVRVHSAVATSEDIVVVVEEEEVLSEAVTVGLAAEAHPAAPTAAAIVKGEEAPIVAAQPPLLKEVTRVVIRGRVRILYDMPWKVNG